MQLVRGGDYAVQVRERTSTFINDVQNMRAAAGPGSIGLVFVSAVAKIKEVCDLLDEAKMTYVTHHPGIDHGAREQSHLALASGSATLCVASGDYGMGMHLPRCSFVVHYDLPTSMNLYAQQIGRAGRDGTPAACLLLYSVADLNNHISALAASSAGQGSFDQFADDRSALYTVLQFAMDPATCRHGLVVSSYFGQDERCGSHLSTNGCCDNCRSPAPKSVADWSFERAAVIKFVSSLPPDNKVNRLRATEILRGLQSLRDSWDDNPQFGACMHMSAVDLTRLLTWMCLQGDLREELFRTLETTRSQKPMRQFRLQCAVHVSSSVKKPHFAVRAHGTGRTAILPPNLVAAPLN